MPNGTFMGKTYLFNKYSYIKISIERIIMNWERILSDCRKYGCYPSIEEFFSTCPILIRNYLTPCTFPAGQLLIKAGSPCGTVYILVSGRLQAIEEKAGEVPYSFFDMIPFDIVGDYELFSEDTESFVTVRALEQAVCLTLPARFYLRWISSDSAALFLRTRLLMKRLSFQLNSNRRILLMSNEQRCMYIICQEAKKTPLVKGVLLFKLNRELLAAKTGCSLRTVHRIVKELENESHLKLVHGKICLTRGQLEDMCESLGCV